MTEKSVPLILPSVLTLVNNVIADSFKKGFCSSSSVSDNTFAMIDSPAPLGKIMVDFGEKAVNIAKIMNNGKYLTIDPF